MKGKELRLLLDEEVVAYSTNVSVEIMQSVNRYTPLPGSAEDDGWTHYRKGNKSWSLTTDGLFTSQYTTLLNASINDHVFEADIATPYSDLVGTVSLSEFSLVSQVRHLVKFTCKFVCDGFLNLT